LQADDGGVIYDLAASPFPKDPAAYGTQSMTRRLVALLAGTGLALGLSGCSFLSSGEKSFPQPVPGTANRYNPSPKPGEPDATGGGLFGGDGISLLGGKPSGGQGGGAGIGVNGLLWRASLDTLSFMPLASADPFGGVIITDWYTSPDSTTERFKATVYILDKELRADGVKVSIFRQEKRADGGWVDTVVSAETSTKLENAILTRARQLRIAQFGK
jgi:hypothetical protein